MRLAERECGRSRQKCRSEKEKERIVQKMHKGNNKARKNRVVSMVSDNTG